MGNPSMQRTNNIVKMLQHETYEITHRLMSCHHLKHGNCSEHKNKDI
jgi:hypothetical protein